MPETPQSTPKGTAADLGSVVGFPGSPEHGGTQDDNLLRLSGLVGRGWEIAEVEGLLSDHRLLTLTGPRGSGKTRLALAPARQGTLMATMDWSHELLSERERVLFSRLLVFVKGLSY